MDISSELEVSPPEAHSVVLGIAIIDSQGYSGWQGHVKGANWSITLKSPTPFPNCRQDSSKLS